MTSKSSRIACLVLGLGLICGPVTAQAQLEVETRIVQQLAGVDGVRSFDGVVVVAGDPDGMTLQPAAIISIKSEAANVEVNVERQDRSRVSFKRLSDANGASVYLIQDSGKFWIDITAIDFEKNIYRRETGLTVEVPKASPVGPSVPDIEPPSPTLKALVLPIGAALASSPEKAAALSAAFQGFADGARVVFPSGVEKLRKTHSAAMLSVGIPIGASVGSMIDDLIAGYLGIERDSQRRWLDRPLTASDQSKLVEAYDAIAWGVIQ